MTFKELVKSSNIKAYTIDVDVWNEELDDFEERIGFEGDLVTLAEVVKYYHDFYNKYENHKVNCVDKVCDQYGDFTYVNIELQALNSTRRV